MERTPKPDVTAAEPYEIPRIETVLTPDDLEREILYAGVIVSPDT